jgi:hypothetical protein
MVVPPPFCASRSTEPLLDLVRRTTSPWFGDFAPTDIIVNWFTMCFAGPSGDFERDAGVMNRGPAGSAQSITCYFYAYFFKAGFKDVFWTDIGDPRRERPCEREIGQTQ